MLAAPSGRHRRSRRVLGRASERGRWAARARWRAGGFGSRSRRASSQEPPRESPLAPAAQWCARMMVLSIICRVSASPPPSARACNSKSYTLGVVQRRNCRHKEFQLPNSSGRSRHGAPVRAIQNMPSNTRRWSAAGRRPPTLSPGMARKAPTPHPLSDHEPSPTSDPEVSLESHHLASGNPVNDGWPSRAMSR